MGDTGSAFSYYCNNSPVFLWNGNNENIIHECLFFFEGTVTVFLQNNNL